MVLQWNSTLVCPGLSLFLVQHITIKSFLDSNLKSGKKKKTKPQGREIFKKDSRMRKEEWLYCIEGILETAVKEESDLGGD